MFFNCRLIKLNFCCVLLLYIAHVANHGILPVINRRKDKDGFDDDFDDNFDNDK